MTKLDYEIIASGSSGNAVRIENILVDCGVPQKKIDRALYQVDYLLITHVHGDHLKPSTFSRIQRSFPHIKTVGNYEVAYRAKVDIISGHYKSIQLGEWLVTPFPCVHDVVTQGFVLEKENLSIIYATDTAIMDNAPRGKKYDYFFIESNHDENKIEQARKSKKYGYDVWKSAQRHLSTQAAKAFYYINRKNKDSKFIELHKSTRFY